MTISTVGASALSPQRVQARASQAAQSTVADSASAGTSTLVGRNLPSGGRNGPPPPPMQGWSSAGQGFGADTLASLISTQEDAQQGAGAAARVDRAAAMFTDADSDGDGAVTSEELAAAMAAHAPTDPPAGAPGAADMAAGMLADGDSDGDGALSLSEFQAMKPARGGPPPGPPPAGGAEDGEASSAASTDAADLNGDGVVSADELSQTLTSALDSLGSDVSSDASDLLRKLLGQLTSGLADAAASTTGSVDLAA